jgi:hypothetical protein
MKSFKSFMTDALDDEISTLAALDKKRRRRKAPDDINEVSIKPNTARLFSYALLTRAHNHRNAVRSSDDTNAKLNALADLMTDAVYLSLVSIATDQSDPMILRKIPRR